MNRWNEFSRIFLVNKYGRIKFVCQASIIVIRRESSIICFLRKLIFSSSGKDKKAEHFENENPDAWLDTRDSVSSF